MRKSNMRESLPGLAWGSFRTWNHSWSQSHLIILYFLNKLQKCIGAYGSTWQAEYPQSSHIPFLPKGVARRGVPKKYTW